jgi:peptidoglycan/xylan/chitin deacetylase (PgdA/CDA1 family)
MSGYSDQWITLSSEALRARRAAIRRRKRRRRLAAVVLLALIAGAGIAVVLVSGSRARLIHPVRHRPATHRHLAPSPAQLAALTAKRENAAINALLERQPFIRAGGGERRDIALTFDDGPGPYTPRLVEVLHRLHAPATFFEVGFMFRWFRGAAALEQRMGDVIGDHTETHPRMSRLSRAGQLSQIVGATKWTDEIGAPFPRLWRPPYGSYNTATLAILRQLHMLMVLWTVDTEDYLRPGVRVIVHRALAGARPGAIILLHDAGGNRSQTIQALPVIVHALRRRGYKLVTIPQLILEDPPRGHQLLPAHLPGD